MSSEVAKSQGDVRAPTVAKYRATTAATARISRRRSAEIVKSIPQERISERSQVTRVPKISCQESVEVDPVLLRTVKQFLDKGRESPSRYLERIRERILEQVEKEKNPSVFLTV